MLEFLGILSGVVSVICYLPYIYDIFRKNTKPERASWLIWTVLGGIAFFSQLAKGATYSLWMPAVQTVGVALIFLLSLFYGKGGFQSRDIKALAVAFIGVALWFTTQEAAYALFIVIIVDAAGAFLTIVKAYEDPESETLITWFLSGLSGLFAMFAVGKLDLIQLSYPLYIWLINWMVVVAMLMGRKKSQAR